MSGFQREFGERPVSLLASTFVVVGGTIICATMGSVFSGDPWKPIALGAGIFGGVWFVLWLLRDKPANSAAHQAAFAWLRRRHRAVEPEYEVRRRHRPNKTPLGSNEPPSAESVREIRDGANTWVPTSVPKNRHDGRDRD